MTSDGFQGLIQRLKSRTPRATMTVAGDLCLDRYVFGAVERISPEAPVPVLHEENGEERLGCMANVVLNVAALQDSIPVHQKIYGVVGQDIEGERVVSSLMKIGSEWVQSRILRDDSRPTTLKTRYIAGTQHQLLRVDREDTHAISAAHQADFLKYLSEDLKNSKILLLQDYAKGLFTEEFLSNVKDCARKTGVKTLLDPNRNTPPEYYEGISLITPNIAEAERLLEGRISLLKGADEGAVEKACRELRKKLKLEMCLITRSSHGMTLLDSDDRIHHFPAVARSVFDVTGAGDTVVAILGAALAAGYSAVDACWLSTAAASVVVAKVGTAVASTREIVEELERLSSIA